MIAILRAAGLSAGEAVLVASLIGPMQVTARIVELAVAKHVRALAVGRMAFILVLAALLLLWSLAGFSPLAFVFVGLYGASYGIMTIVRGTVPAELFGRVAYGELLGRLARPVFAARAIAPLAFSVLLALGAAYDIALLVLVACAVLGLIAYQLACAERRLGYALPAIAKRTPAAARKAR